MIQTLRLVAALFAGMMFGLGLSVAQMIDPAKVIGFLNIFGAWDPSLAFVMGGGLAVNLILTPLIFKQARPWLADYFRLPAKTEIDRRIVLGGIIFGAGWGLAGYCPGPMITSLSFANSSIITIILAYLVGTWITQQALAWIDQRPSRLARA
ncbi:YeeE/YedE family protein [Saccharospirillum sp. MSK14-1]|uniref:YeeE/YedE family protein n=1 Tax=Saccharospirillum sp. MSK14-1 TaxID=1897632 RepID=UPI000D34DC22|nr:YeeE/YedE family protein [Saccharospirillum sp. MSK14-1]PTY35978.1 YeeE/YedE family protein [Saccharospirillum sp. MSK14-1]